MQRGRGGHIRRRAHLSHSRRHSYILTYSCSCPDHFKPLSPSPSLPQNLLYFNLSIFYRDYPHRRLLSHAHARTLNLTPTPTLPTTPTPTPPLTLFALPPVPLSAFPPHLPPLPHVRSPPHSSWVTSFPMRTRSPPKRWPGRSLQTSRYVSFRRSVPSRRSVSLSIHGHICPTMPFPPTAPSPCIFPKRPHGSRSPR